MPVESGTGNFNTGRDCQIVLVGPFGQVNIPNVTMFDCKQQTNPIKITRLDSIHMHAELPAGWQFSIEAERADSTLDDLFAQIEAAWYYGGIIQNTTLFQYVTERDGSQSTFQMTSAALKYDDPGSWTGDKSVKQKLSGMCDQRRKV